MTATSNYPETMQVAEIAEPGGPEVLQPAERSTPNPGSGEVLIQVAAAGVNRPDVLQRQGGYPPPPGASDVPGLEIAGTVAAVGSSVVDFAVGDAVCALVTGGGYAQFCPAPAPQVLPIPAGLDMIEAAALPETFFTVWTNVFDRGRLRPGEAFLVHGGSSGIGTVAIQLANAFEARVFATAGSARKCAECERLGAVRAINYRDEDFVDAVKSETGGRGVDLILDMVGGDYVQRNFSALAVEGRLVQIAFLGGSKTELNLMSLMLKRLTLTGATLRGRTIEDKAAIAKALRDRVWPLLESARVRPVIDSTFPLADATKAHERMESGEHIGKIVLTV